MPCKTKELVDNSSIMSADMLEAARFEQLESLSETVLGTEPLVVHGSIARAAMMGESMPDLLMSSGRRRDIDVFVSSTMGKTAIETHLTDAGLDIPCTVDAGLCDILVRDGTEAFACRRTFAVPLKGVELFDEVQDYELPGSDGLTVRSFSPAGMLAAHLLQEPLYRPDHYMKDRRFIAWLKRNDVNLPAELRQSIEEFHQAYHEAYPYGETLLALSEVYRVIVPEAIRKKFRHGTHRFMLKHAGRLSPYADSDDSATL